APAPLPTPGAVAGVAAVAGVGGRAPAPANPSRMPAVAMIPSLAIRLQDRSESGSVTAARTRASQPGRPPPVIAASRAGVAAASRARRADKRPTAPGSARGHNPPTSPLG